MESRLHFKMRNCSTVTALSYHPFRREAITGHEDGVIVCWKTADSETPVLSRENHRGRLITSFAYWEREQSLFSSSLEGTLIQWSNSFILIKELHVGCSIHSLCWFPHKEKDKEVLLVGLSDTLGLLQPAKSSSYSTPKCLKNYVHRVSEGHSDIVQCIATAGNKVFTAGYDRCLCVYELAHHHAGLEEKDKKIFNLIHMKSNAHDAGITCLELGWDSSGTIWIFTGSYDKQVKSWSPDGNLISRIQLPGTVSGIGFMIETGVLWVAADSKSAYHFEPKSGENISMYLEQSSHSLSVLDKTCKAGDSLQSKLKHLKYTAESGEIIGTTDNKELVVSKTSRSSCVCVQASSHPLNCVTYTKTTPILIFTGSAKGELIKWERQQLNPYKYNQEELLYKDDLKSHLSTEQGSANLSYFINGSDEDPYKELNDEDNQRARSQVMKMDNREFVKMIFIESLDLLVASAWDGKIFVWGFDDRAAEVLAKMNMSLEENAPGDKITEEDLVTCKRVAGQVMKYILNGHCGPVPAIALVEGSKKTKHTCIVTGGWDVSLCVWNIENGRMLVQVKESIPTSDDCFDLLITGVAYSNAQEMIAYSASNHKIYLRNFGVSQSELSLVRTLEGHVNEVSQICWNPCKNTWVSGSQDGELRVWSADGTGCIKILSTAGGSISALTIDHTQNLIIACVQKTLKVYNDSLDVVQVSQGHDKTISDLVIIPELNQYISVSIDGSLRVWNAHIPK